MFNTLENITEQGNIYYVIFNQSQYTEDVSVIITFLLSFFHLLYINLLVYNLYQEILLDSDCMIGYKEQINDWFSRFLDVFKSETYIHLQMTIIKNV